MKTVLALSFGIISTLLMAFNYCSCPQAQSAVCWSLYFQKSNWWRMRSTPHCAFTCSLLCQPMAWSPSPRCKPCQGHGRPMCCATGCAWRTALHPAQRNLSNCWTRLPLAPPAATTSTSRWPRAMCSVSKGTCSGMAPYN